MQGLETIIESHTPQIYTEGIMYLGRRNLMENRVGSLKGTSIVISPKCLKIISQDKPKSGF